MIKKNDNILVKESQAGNKEAFCELVSKYKKQVYEVVYSFTHDVQDAYDLSQEVFVKTFNAIQRFRGDSNFYTWLYQVALNTGIDYLRRSKRKRTITSVNELSEEISQNQVYQEGKYAHNHRRSLLNEQICDAINQLSPSQKQVFILRHYQNLKLKKVAEILGMKVGSVKNHHFNAVHKLRKLLSHYVECRNEE